MFEAVQIGSSPVVAHSHVAAIEGEVQAVDSLQVEVPAREVGEDRQGGNVGQLDRVLLHLGAEGQNLRRGVEFQS